MMRAVGRRAKSAHGLFALAISAALAAEPLLAVAQQNPASAATPATAAEAEQPPREYGDTYMFPHISLDAKIANMHVSPFSSDRDDEDAGEYGDTYIFPHISLDAKIANMHVSPFS